MKNKMLILGFLFCLLFVVSCSTEEFENTQNTLPQANIDDADNVITVSELFELSGDYKCSWDFAGDQNYAVDPAKGSFILKQDGSYYFENIVQSELEGEVRRYALYNSQDATFYTWNNQASNNIGAKMDQEMYSATVIGNTISYRTYFDLLENIDYGIDCVEIDSVSLPEIPDKNWV